MGGGVSCICVWPLQGRFGAASGLLVVPAGVQVGRAEDQRLPAPRHLAGRISANHNPPSRRDSQPSCADNTRVSTEGAAGCQCPAENGTHRGGRLALGPRRAVRRGHLHTRPGGAGRGQPWEDGRGGGG